MTRKSSRLRQSRSSQGRRMASLKSPKEVLPQRRILCRPSTVIVGEREYQSASEALLAYIQQFEPGGGNQSGVPLASGGNHRAPSAALQAEVEDALHEAKLKRLLKESQAKQMSKAKQSSGSNSNNNVNNNSSSALRQEVDEALTRSADLLERIKSDSSPPQCVSSIGSLSTDALLSVDTSGAKQGHIYSYRRNRSSSVPARPMTVFTPIKEYTPRSSSRSPPPSSRTPRMGTPRSGGLGLAEAGAASSQTRLRSRSVSPSLLHPPSQSQHRAPSWLEDLDPVLPEDRRGREGARKSVPSWVDDLNASGVSSAASRGRPQPKRQQAPSWVLSAAEKSDIASTSSVVAGLDLGLPSVGFPSHDTTVDSRPGLNYSDLFSAEGALGGEGARRGARESPRLPPQSPGKTVTFDPSLRDASANDSDLDRSRQRLAASKAAELKAKLDKYIDEFDFNELLARGGQAAGSSGLRADNSESRGDNSDLGAVPRCSSMDTVALMAGALGPGSHISGASPILKSSDLDENARMGNKGRGSGAASVNTDQILEGDRPWETAAKYKDPVYPGTGLKLSPEDDLRLSGSGQPGSMEALKNMYFRLQAEEQNTSRDPESMLQDAGAGGGELPLPALKGYDFTGEPGGESLEKALVHLSRLKNLVQNSEKNGPKTS